MNFLKGGRFVRETQDDIQETFYVGIMNKINIVVP